ncbi:MULTISPECIES: phosphoketolase family protein [Actinomycetes]|uniref:Probable phosphoketolase n=1 Tax=Parenemella sanctibonifatiensis TaxID=2016505 RepID=A0A255EM26_9ACTN|nr:MULTISPECIES: phosphoketolase family protein [Actinomycetes]MAM55080.1 phosphoketolase [Microbacterium sp.]OYN92554.1 phosphoketolase [Parenemella sanctibonifatiensis]RGE18878.1 phosphoketolase family protein [Leucobacter sp. wl10]WJG12390.1 phosphoketolase family protein [Gordonia sp. Swx-4]|tara:strand:+ start:33808 stop:36279 length:2472 start_codon:yes stop_codon:yes gene_type:complete
MTRDARVAGGAAEDKTTEYLLAPDDAAAVDAWWRAANYLAVGQIYLMGNALLKRPLAEEDIKPRLLGHWGTSPGQNFLYAHLNHQIIQRNLDMIYLSGPGHGGPSLVAASWLEGTYSEVYSHVGTDARGVDELCRQFSFPGGIPSHVAPETPGSIHEGGELGYVLSHAYGAAFDNPDLIAVAVIGDGEAETAPLATAWHSNKFLDPQVDGTVLPILHLNGYKIANPTIFDRIPRQELESLLVGYGHKPYFFEGGFDDEDITNTHRRFARLLAQVLDEVVDIRARAADGRLTERARWPMIVFRTPKGWTGPQEVDGLPVENSWRSHQVPMSAVRGNEEYTRLLESWMHSYRPEELFGPEGRIMDLVAQNNPVGTRRMSANPHANGGLLTRDLDLPDFRDYGVDVPVPGGATVEATRVLGGWVADVVDRNRQTFRVFGPDETHSNRLGAAVEAGGKAWQAELLDTDVDLSRTGRVMEVLSEHQVQGWLEGYLLTGRHGLLNSYEAFIHIIDSMFNQHAKWLDSSRDIPWRVPVPSLNYLLSSHVWRQDHNGFSHQDPGFLDVVMNKTADVTRIYLPPDANTLLSTFDHVLRTRNYVNVVVAGKQPGPQWLTMDEAVLHCTRGIGIWDWAGSEEPGSKPDVVLGCAGDVPTMEAIAAARLLRERLPELKVRVVNVVDLMRLQDEREHPHGLSHRDFDALFTADRPVIFAFHGYPSLVHQLTYRRTNHHNIHVRGFKEKGTTTTPFDMLMLNDLDRYRLVIDAIDRVGLAERESSLRQEMLDSRVRARQHTRKHGQDLPEVTQWVVQDGDNTQGSGAPGSDTGGDNE